MVGLPFIVILNKGDFVTSLGFFVLGVLMAFKAMSFPIWSESGLLGLGPQEGFFPLVAAVIIIGLSLLIMINSSGLARAQEREVSDKENYAPNFFRVSSYVILMLSYGILIERIGFLITSSLLLLFMLRYVESQSWRITMVVAIVSIVISYFLFVYFLGVPLPSGLVKWLYKT